MKFAVMGNGAWGQALAFVASQAGHDAVVWSRRLRCDDSVRCADAVVLAVPAQDVRAALSMLDLENQSVICAAKGIEKTSGFFMADVVKACTVNCQIHVLSGPSFAADVMANKPTAVTLAGASVEAAQVWATALSLPHFRIYASDDVAGVEIGGALKNVLAVACGISDGQGLGDSARASLTTRGFAELIRFGKKSGGRPETLMGLSGLGDLLLTCASVQSRNYAFGLALGQGASVKQALANSRGVVEGAATAGIAAALARRHGIEMPIVSAVAAIVEGHSSPQREIEKLLSRPVGPEFKES